MIKIDQAKKEDSADIFFWRNNFYSRMMFRRRQKIKFSQHNLHRFLVPPSLLSVALWPVLLAEVGVLVAVGAHRPLHAAVLVAAAGSLVPVWVRPHALRVVLGLLER